MTGTLLIGPGCTREAKTPVVTPKPAFEPAPSSSTTPMPIISPAEVLTAYWSAIKEQRFSEAEKHLSNEALNYFLSHWEGLKDYASKNPPYRGFEKLEIIREEPLPDGEFLGKQVRIYSTKWYLDQGQSKKWEYVDYLIQKEDGWNILITPILGPAPRERTKRFYTLLNEGKYREAKNLLSPSTGVVLDEKELGSSFSKFFRGRKIEKIDIEDAWPHQPRFVPETDGWAYDFWIKGKIKFTDGSEEPFQEHLVETPDGFKIGHE